VEGRKKYFRIARVPRVSRNWRRLRIAPLHGFARAVFAAAVFLILPAYAFAQQVGVKAGINFASLPPEEDENPDIPPRLGPVGGVWVRTAPANRFSFQAEGLFSEKGTHWDFDPGFSIEIPRSLHRDPAAGARRLRRPGLDHAGLCRWRRRAGVQAVGSAHG